MTIQDGRNLSVYYATLMEGEGIMNSTETNRLPYIVILLTFYAMLSSSIRYCAFQLMARGRLGVTGARAQKHVEVVYNHEAARAPTLHHNMAVPTVPASRLQHRPVTHTTVQVSND